MKSRARQSFVRWSAALGLAVLALILPQPAAADVRLEGDWANDPSVSLDVSGASRAHAIELLAAAAGWSIVLNNPLPDSIDVHVKDQPASKVLGLLLPGGDFVARRSGTLVSIGLGAAAGAPPVPPPVPPPPRAASRNGEDRTVFGGNLTIEPADVVHDVTVFGGHAEVLGTVTGDLSVFGGSARVHDGAKVLGTATVVGGEMHIDDGAVVDHDVGVVGGHLDRKADDDQSWGIGSVPGKPGKRDHTAEKSSTKHAFEEWTEHAGSSLSAAALLFVFGAVVIALATDRSRLLRVEVAARPMRTFALGVVGTLGALAVFVALCVTIIGIPVALVGLVLFVVASYAGVSAVLTTAGEAVLRHRTDSPYVHLAFGCAIYLVLQLVPFIGSWVSVALALVGIGVMVATRGAGFVPVAKSRLASTTVVGDDLR